jgi:hypothetical protein
MDTTTSAVTSGLIVVAGRWAQGKGLDAKVLLGAGFMAIGLTVLASINEPLARGFSVLVLVSVLLTYGIPIFKKAGLAK